MNRLRTRWLAILCLPLSALALDQTDAGIYAVVSVDGRVTDKLLRVTLPASNWKVEDQNPDGSWKDISCDAGCAMIESAAADVERFLGKLPGGAAAECINDSAFAICRTNGRDHAKEREYFFVALTRDRPIVLHLVRRAPAQGGWRDEQGHLGADTDARKSVDGFGGWIVVTPDADWREKWETPSGTTPHFTQAKSVALGQPVFVLTFFANPLLDADGRADVACDIDVVRPDGTSSTHQQGASCFDGPLKDPRLMYLSAPVIGFVGDPGDPLGEWTVRVTLVDKVRKVRIPLKATFVLADK